MDDQSSWKRAVVACNFCRQRKRRCDGATPQCTTCRRKRLHCTYKDVPVKTDATKDVSDALFRRLDTIESLLRRHTSAIEALERGSSSTTSPYSPQIRHHGSQASPADSQSSAAAHTSAQLPHSIWALSNAPSRDSDDEVPALTIPLGHQTSTSSLLLLPQMESLVGDVPEEFLFKVEDSRPRSVAFDMTADAPFPDIARAAADAYLESYFTRVHPLHPFFDKKDLRKRYESTMDEGLRSDTQSALFLAIFALGATVLDPLDGSQGREHAGDPMIQRALRVLLTSWAMSFSGDILLTQALILAALYFTYTVEPLMAWRLVHMASTSVQQMLIRCKDNLSSETEIQEVTRISWVCFIIECDILAEFHQPRSGIELLVDRMPFPNYGKDPEPEHYYCLAEISARSLLNRIHHIIYFTDSQTIYAGRALDTLSSSMVAEPPYPGASLLRVCGELNRQLESWYDALPECIKPDLAGNEKGSKQACLLRLRYWSAKQCIYRPFIVYVTAQFSEREVEIPDDVLDKCRVCLEACRGFIVTSGHLLSERTPYTYSAAQCTMTCMLVLSIAAQSAPLKGFVEDIETLQDTTAFLLKQWATPGSSIECSYEIASSIARKRRLRGHRRR